jgi:predicted phosphodiesterase
VRVAVVSDIHSNVLALAAVLDDIAQAGVDETWLAGDTFGYYPWASSTFAAVQSAGMVAVLGNHDRWVASGQDVPDDIAGRVALHNAEQLHQESPAALAWLASLPLFHRVEHNGWAVTMTHGTPSDPLEGRYYPDDVHEHDWLPGQHEILILGQTHYPILRETRDGGLVLNPGSVGQPRDGDPMPSWAVLDLETGRAELRRTPYDNADAMRRLRGAGWDDRVTAALNRRRGPRAR